MVGSFLGGFLGDCLGRRPPLLLSYAIATMAQAGTAVVRNFSVLLFLRMLIGVAHGVGMPASLAIVSESSPSNHRVTLGGMRHLNYALGGVAVSLLFCYDSPSLGHLHWSWESMIVAIPPFAIGVVALALLPESPVFLASAGRHEEAKAVLRQMRRLNFCDESVEMALDPHFVYPVAPTMRGSKAFSAKAKDQAGCVSMETVSATLGRHRTMWIITLMVGAATMNLVGLGHLYAFPRVASAVHSTWSAGYQNLLQNVSSFFMGCGVVGMTRFLSCRMILFYSGVIGILGLAIFVQTGSMLVRSSWAEFIYLSSQNTPMLASAMGILGVYQLSVDLFPVRARVISAGICIAAGRITAISAPFIFEAFSHWQHFYILMIGLCFLSSGMAMVHLPTREGEKDLVPLVRGKV